jgi:hypothetical protein
MRTTINIRSCAKLGALITAVTLMMPACGSDDDAGDGGGNAGGGSCTNSDGCWEVSTPTNYDVATECAFTQGNWSADTCDPSGYARKCTQITQVSENDGPEMDVTYVYYFPPASTFACLGTEETL